MYSAWLDPDCSKKTELWIINGIVGSYNFLLLF
jgi:hypothetical protein